MPKPWSIRFNIASTTFAENLDSSDYTAWGLQFGFHNCCKFSGGGCLKKSSTPVKISLEIQSVLSDFIIWVSVTGEYVLSFMYSLALKHLFCTHNYFAKSRCGFWICLENCIPLIFDTRKTKHPESQIILKSQL